MNKILVALALMATGCGFGSTTRIVTREAWDLKVPGKHVTVAGEDDEPLLKVSADGKTWKWSAPAEEVVTSLFKHIARREAIFSAYVESKEKKPQPEAKAAKAEKKP